LSIILHCSCDVKFASVVLSQLSEKCCEILIIKQAWS
jgi:hypothetical protein